MHRFKNFINDKEKTGCCIQSLGYSIVMTIWGFLGLILLLGIQFLTKDKYDIISQGEIIIIGVSLLINSIYILKRFNYKDIPSSTFLFWFELLIYTFLVAIYVLIRSTTLPISSFSSIKIISIVVIFIVFFSTWYTHYLDSSESNVLADRNQQANDLEDRLDNIGE